MRHCRFIDIFNIKLYILFPLAATEGYESRKKIYRYIFLFVGIRELSYIVGKETVPPVFDHVAHILYNIPIHKQITKKGVIELSGGVKLKT